jgi:hypothetical protein
MRFLRSFNVAGKTKLLELTYMVTAALLLSTVVFATVFIAHHFLFVKKYVIQEDAVEALLISILLLIAYLLSHLYKRELRKYLQETRQLSRDKNDLSNKLTDAFKYIGGVNVQIHETRSILCGRKRYAETENEFRKDLALLARKILGIVNADWSLIRIIGQTNLRTITEHLENRGNAKFIIKGISNKAIVANQTLDEYSIIASRHDNSTVMVACVFPKKNLDEAERILVEAITYQIEMLYIIFVSRHTQKTYPNHQPKTPIPKTTTPRHENRLDNSTPHQEQ